jgi:hypothetical protein
VELPIFILKLDNTGDLVWVKQIGGSNHDNGESIKVDNSGNVYITGFFSGTVDFDPGPDTFNLTTSGNRNMFIQKLNDLGDLVWVKQIEGNDTNLGESVFIDNLENVYVTGYFEGAADFDPGPNTLSLNSNGGQDIFILKLDDSGNFVWAKQMGGNSFDMGESIAVDNLGNVYTTGFFEGAVDFDPGLDTLKYSSNGDRDIFVQKLDNSGDLVWVKQMGGGGPDIGEALVLDTFGNIYTTGTFRFSADFDPGFDTLLLNSNGDRDIFIQKLDNSGDLVWVKQMGGVFFDKGQSITVDDQGNIYTTGYFRGIVDFDPGVDTFNLTSFVGDRDIFIQKLDASGNFVGVGHVGGPDREEGKSIAIDNLTNIYVTGYFYDSVDFDPGTDSFNLTSLGNEDLFVLKLKNIIAGTKDQINNLDIVIYPNPTSNTFIIDKGINSEISVYVFDNMGKLIVSKTSNNQITRIDISNYSPGIYYLYISNGVNTTTEKIIKL